jgi:hypothetical protein
LEPKKITASVGVGISDVNQVAMDWARDHAGERLGTKWYDGEGGAEPSEKWPVSESVRLAVRKIMTEAFSREMPMRDLVQRIQTATGFPKERATLIADTEAKFAMARGNIEAWKRTGVIKAVEWVLSADHKEIDECDLNSAAGPIPVGQLFPSGDPAPPAHAGCCCALRITRLNDPKRRT